MQNRRGQASNWLWEVEATDPPWLQLLSRQMTRLSDPIEASACHTERPTKPLSQPCDNLNLAT